MKPVTIAILAQLFSWTIFILGDYIDKMVINKGYAVLVTISLPVILPICYLIFQKKVHNGSYPKWVNTITVMAMWNMTNLIIARIIISLWASNKWFIPMPDSGWDYFLNALAYIVFPIFNLIIPSVILLIWSLIVLLKRKL